MIQFLTVFIIAVLVVIDQLIKLAVLKYLEPIGSLAVLSDPANSFLIAAR